MLTLHLQEQGWDTRMDHCRILIVEDDPLISSHLEALVTKTIASDVLVTTSVTGALEALRDAIDFALLDVDVVGGTTYVVAATLSSAAIPFAFVSASDRNKVPQALRDVPFVAKPYTEEEIVALLRATGKCAA